MRVLYLHVFVRIQITDNNSISGSKGTKGYIYHEIEKINMPINVEFYIQEE